MVTIVSARFEVPELIEPRLEPWYKNSQMVSLIKSSAVAAAFIALLLLVVKPAIGVYFPAPEPQGSASDVSSQTGTRMPASSANAKRTGVLAQSDILGGEPNSSSGYDHKVEAVRALVDMDSGRVANLLKNMIQNK